MFFSRISVRTYTSQRLVFSEFGQPSSVLRLEKYDIEPTNNGKVLVKMLAAPVNPADINVIQGVYPIKPRPSELPATPGAEGVGIVVHSSSENFKVGDKVLPTNKGFGTWQGYINRDESELIKINKDLDIIAAATFQVNPPTALRMLSDFEKLKPGDTVIQNGGTSGVGQAVIQLCSILGLKSISIIRNRNNLDVAKKYLEGLGKNSLVLTEEELRGWKEAPKCQLALNCVSGKSVIGLVKALEDGRTLVTYGGMSKQPLIVPTASFIFNDIKLKGFWMSRWRAQANHEEFMKMFDYLSSLYVHKQLVPPGVETLKLSDFQKAVDESAGGKYVFIMNT